MDVDKLEHYQLKYREWIETDGDHYPEISENSQRDLYTGKHSSVSVRTGGEYLRYKFTDMSAVNVKVYENTYALPIDVDARDVVDLVMAADYCQTELKKMPHKKAVKTRLYKVSKMIERNLQDMLEKKTKTLTFDVIGEIGEVTFSKIDAACRLEVEIAKLIEQDKIPAETRWKKYPRDTKKFHEMLPKIQAKHESHKLRIIDDVERQ